MSATLVFDNITNKLYIPASILPKGGKPFDHHFQGSTLDNLAELAGRICYDSSCKKQTRNSEDYFKHIREVNHGCYDEQTEILTKEGWKFFQNCDESDLYLTLNPTSNLIEYQKATAIINKDYTGDMIQIKDIKRVDLLITPDHKMYAAPRVNDGSWNYSLCEAKEFLNRSYKIMMSGGEWKGAKSNFSEDALKFIGFFIGDGSKCKDRQYYKFRLKRKRKIKYITDLCNRLGWGINIHNTKNPNLFSAEIKVPNYIKSTLDNCYNTKRKKKIPDNLLNLEIKDLLCILDGLINSDGHITKNGHKRYDTCSYELVGNMQELLLKSGFGFNVTKKDTTKPNHNIAYQIHINKERDKEQRIGWTSDDRKKEVSIIPYKGKIYCVEVPNHIIYVKRNNKCCWSGNSILEHCNLTFHVKNPKSNNEHDSTYNEKYDWLNQAYPILCNRPGVLIEQDNYQNLYITANLRSILEWNKRYDWLGIGKDLQMIASELAPLVFGDLVPTIDVLKHKTKYDIEVKTPDTEEEIWASFYISGVSRGLSHELVRHKYRTAVSQRSTRYVDESESNWEWHPLIKKYKDKFEKVTWSNGNDIMNEVENMCRDSYSFIVGELEVLLLKEGINKFTARKQARGAARGILGNALSTELIFSASLAQWKRMILQRASSAADAEIRLLFNEIYILLKDRFPDYFNGWISKISDDNIGFTISEVSQ